MKHKRKKCVAIHIILKWVNNDLNKRFKMESPLGDNRKMLQETYVTVTREECDSSTFEKLSKNVFHTTQ